MSDLFSTKDAFWKEIGIDAQPRRKHFFLAVCFASKTMSIVFWLFHNQYLLNKSKNWFVLTAIAVQTNKNEKIRVFIGSDISWCEHRLWFQKEITIQSARFYKIINKKPCTLPIYKQRQNTLLSLFIYCSVSIKQLFANRFMQKLWDLQSAWHQGEKWFLWKVFIFGCLKNFNLVILAVEYFCEIVYNICE